MLTHSLNSINAIKTCSKQTNNLQKDQLQTVIEIGTSKPKEPEKALEDEFIDLKINLPVLEVLAHAPMYNAILDKYVESLDLGKNRSAFIQGKMPKKLKDPRLFTLTGSLRDSMPFDALADLRSCMNLIPLYLFKKLKIGLLEETDHVFELTYGTKSYPIGIVRNVEVHIGRLKLLDDFYVIDMDKDPAISLLVGRGFLATANANKPPKVEDGAWHAKILLIDPDGEEFTKTFQSIPTTRKLSEKENPSEIIDLDHFHDS
ncbi:retrovirus-related pol polyprotein from transposon TNT 1-94 [Tanacetum coccineum]